MAFHLTHTREGIKPQRNQQENPRALPTFCEALHHLYWGVSELPTHLHCLQASLAFPMFLNTSSMCSSLGASGLDARDPSRTLSPRHPLLITCSTLRWVTACPATPLHSRNVSSMERPLWSVFFFLYLQCSLQPPAHSRRSVNVCGMTE